MGDDDVICLSSDDEVAHGETPQKKAKINYAPLTAKLEPKDKSKDTILCSLKRKNDDGTEISTSNAIKKLKTEKSTVEEIIIESPGKNEVTKPSMTINDLSVEVLRDKVENGTISINKVTTKKPTEISKPANQPKSGHSKTTIAPVRNYLQKQPTKSNSGESNGKNTIPSKLSISKSFSEKAVNIVVNPLAKLKNEAVSKSSSTMLQTEHRFVDGTSDKNATGADETMALAKSQIDVPNTASVSSKSEDERLTSSTKLENIVDTIENPNAGSSANKIEQDRDGKMTPSEESGASLTIRAASNSPELLILPEVDTPKASKTASDKIAVKALFSKSSNSTPISEGNTSPNTEISTNDSAQSTNTSQNPCLENCQILNDEQEDVLSKPTDSIKSIKETKDSPSVSTSEGGDTTEPSSKFDASGIKIRTKNDGSAIRRITPQRVPETMSKSDESNSDTEKTSKSVKNAESRNSKEPDSDIANGHEKSMSNDKQHSKTKNECSSNNLVPKTSCSKASDEKKSSSLKQKSTSPKTVEKATKKSEDASIFEEFEPQPGCSKSPDVVTNAKPRLVVFDKKPVSHETEDTFSMFLSLCLQTDRTSDMEKVVAKLKRYYEELNPAYAASQAFRDTLNEKRDLIMRKGKKVVYHYVQMLKEDMKAKKKMGVAFAMGRESEAAAANGENEIADVNEVEEDSEEARRVRKKIKRIEKAMKECQKMIKKYEEAEIDFDDENNSHYIKLDRFKERMVELYTQMCKYTHEHPDAGRAYLRPKHLRVTQIPSVNQAINSFINSKLTVNKNKVTKGKSFIDGLIFPDYVDILECVEKVNKEEKMNLSKRFMQNMAEKAFTQMGKHLQEARQNDYWDTFSLHLDNNVDPAASDSDLLEKLSHNKKIAEENEKKVFEEFVRRQEEGKTGDKDASSSEGEDEDDVEDEEQEEEEEEEDNGKKRNCIVESDEEMSIIDDTDHESAKEDNEDTLQAIETISEAPGKKDEEFTVEDDTEHISKNNNLEPSESTADKETETAAPSSKDFGEKEEPMMIEVILDDVETEDGETEPREEEKLVQPLRIRSFAKPPDSWQCSQEDNVVKNADGTTKAETLEDTEEEISVVSVVPGREKIGHNLTNNNKIVVGGSLNTITKNITASPTTKSKLPNTQSVIVPSTSTNTSSGQNQRFIAIAPGGTRLVKLPSTRFQNNIQTTNIVGVSRPPQMPAINAKQVRLAVAAATSTPTQRVQLPISRYVTVAANSTSINPPQTLPGNTSAIGRPVQIPPGLTLTQVRPGQILQGSNLGQIRPQIVPRNCSPFGKGVTLTSTPIQQRSNYHSQNKGNIPANLSGAQSSQLQVLRVNNGKCTTSSTENLQILQQADQNASQQQQKLSNVTAPVKAGTIVTSTPLPVLKPRINDNVQIVQQQKTNVPRAPRPGDQNRQTSEGGPKRKNENL